ncbi:MAG: hypothetical protein OEU26_00585, partial [Candidatus Tectomicrobia bacterium]|nr:hypothetical protein [Candidatus Tectomicrobia bacterium]
MESQLQELEKSNLSKEELAEAQNLLGKFLLTLTEIEEATEQRNNHRALVEGLPKRLADLAKERQKLEAQKPRRFSTVNEALRDEYEKRRDKIQAQIAELNSKTSRGEVRLVQITEALEKRPIALAQLEKELLEAQGNTVEGAAQDDTLSTIEQLVVQVRRERVEIEALEAERTWLSKRVVLYDALLNIAGLRLRHTERDLETIKQSLAKSIRQEYQALSAQAKRVEEALIHVDDPAEKRRLAVEQETLSIRLLSSDYRQQLNELDDRVQVHETRNARLKRETEHLTSLVEKYIGGEQVAQRLLRTFKRLRLERERYSNDPVQAFKMQLHSVKSTKDPIQDLKAREQMLTEALFALEDRLYGFDRKAEGQLAGMTIILSAVQPAQRDKTIAAFRKELEAQKTALRENQQILTHLIQQVAYLVSLYHEYVRMLDESYNLVLNKMFLVRDGEPLNWAMLPSILESIETITEHLDVLLQLRFSQLRDVYFKSFTRGLIVVLIVMTGLCLAWWGRQRLWRLAATALATSESRHDPPGLSALIFLALQAAVWPLGLALLAWLYMTFTLR